MFGLSSLATKAIIGGILASLLLAGALYVKHVISENAVLSQQLDEAVALNKANVLEIEKFKTDTAAATAAVAAQHTADLARAQRAAKLREEIAHAPKTDDGSVAPVLAHALDGLRHQPAANQAGH